MADNTIIPDGSISGNKVSGGVITQFQSTGIQDLAGQTSLIVSNGMATVDTIRTKKLDGNVQVAGNLTVDGTISVSEDTRFLKDLIISGNISANTITVANLIADVTQETREPLTFTGMQNADLNGKGLVWKVGPTVVSSLLYRNGRLASTLEIDLGVDQSYHISGSPVLSHTALGTGVTSSNLKTLGRLQSLTVDGLTEINGLTKFNNSVEIDGPVTITGTLTAQTIKASQVITESGAAFELGNFTANTEQQLNGQGIHWVTGTSDNMLVYRNGSRLWTNSHLDLDVNSSFRIDNVPVLSNGTLGSTIVNSNLKTVGTLESLSVSGDTALGEFVFINSTYNRIGIGTDEPNASFSIVDNNVEIGIESQRTNVASIGTHSNHDLEITTDNIARITVKNSGEVNFGNAAGQNAVVNIYGTLHVSNLVADTRIDRTSPMQFQATTDTSIYGLGLVWSGTGAPRQLIMMAGPDRLYSSESIDLHADQSYYIGSRVAVTATGLGSSIVNSNLTALGTLNSLSVSGHSTFLDDIDASQGNVKVKSLLLNDGTNSIDITTANINFGGVVSITNQQSNVLSSDSTQIVLGDKSNTRKTVKVFGALTVGVNNPDPSLSFAVNGDVSIGNKRFTNNTSFPTVGTYNAGDVCWNTEPRANSYVGWVCTVSGNPGQWLGFGMIANQ